MKILWPLLTITLALPVRAENVCDKAINTPDLNECLHQEHQRIDKKLNSAYQAALNRVSGIDDDQQRKVTKQELVEAQRLWVQFRDKDCGAIYDLWRGGTIRGAMYWGCMIARTEARTKELEAFASQQY
jgi:uncharacterized protein YecT (DUF1311 family)